MTLQHKTLDLHYNLADMQKDYFIPRLNVLIKISRIDSLNIFGIEDADYAEIIDAETRDTIITVKSDICRHSSWTEWETYFKRNDVSVHSPVYRVVKAIFDEEIFIEKDPEDEYDTEYTDYIAGYYI